MASEDANHFRLSQMETVILRLEGKVDKIGEVLQALARMEERDTATQQRLIDGAKTMADLQNRVAGIEQHMPGLKEMRGLINKAIVGCLGAVGLAVIALVLHK